MEIIDESHKHASHKAMQEHSRSNETHFKVVVVSNEFETMKPLERHRAINELLSEELQTGVHALSIVAKTEK